MLAVGAVTLDTSNPPANATVTLGSVIRQCYVLAAYGPLMNNWNYFDLPDHHMPCNASTADIYVTNGNVNLQITDPNGNNNIAYLGNGNWVDFDGVPATGFFAASSDQAKSLVVNGSSASLVSGAKKEGTKLVDPAMLDLQTGDLDCVKITTYPGDYAWIQVTDPGSAVSDIGPDFCFRVSQDPYFDYFQVPADQNQNCTSWGNCS